jgi:hypothetical protein
MKELKKIDRIRKGMGFIINTINNYKHKELLDMCLEYSQREITLDMYVLN